MWFADDFVCMFENIKADIPKNHFYFKIKQSFYIFTKPTSSILFHPCLEHRKQLPWDPLKCFLIRILNKYQRVLLSAHPNSKTVTTLTTTIVPGTWLITVQLISFIVDVAMTLKDNLAACTGPIRFDIRIVFLLVYLEWMLSNLEGEEQSYKKILGMHMLKAQGIVEHVKTIQEHAICLESGICGAYKIALQRGGKYSIKLVHFIFLRRDHGCLII